MRGAGESGVVSVDFGDFRGDEGTPCGVAFLAHASDVGGPELEELAIGVSGDADDALIFLEVGEEAAEVFRNFRAGDRADLS